MIALLLFVAGSGVGAVWTYTMFVQSPTSRFVRRARWALAFCWSGPAVLNVLDEHRVGVVIPIYAVTAAAWLLVSMAAIEWKKINWSLISGVFATWVVTLPFSALVAALFAWVFKFVVKA